MNKLTIIALTVLIAFYCTSNHFAQSKWALGLNYTASFDYAFSPPGLPEPKGQQGFNTGFAASYFLSDRFSIESGITYQRIKLLWAKDGVVDTRYAWTDMNGNGVFDLNDRLDPDNMASGDLYYQYNILNIPFSLNYRTSWESSTGFIASAGVVINYIYNVKNIGDTHKSTNTVYHEENVNDISQSVSLGAALYQPLGSKLFGIAGPRYSYDINSGDRYFKAKYHSFGFNIKLGYSF